MIHALMPLIAMLQMAAPLEAALKASEAPNTVRVAFELELKSDSAVQVYQFDPRLDKAERWRLISEEGEDVYLDQVGAVWGAEEAPDGRLFPDDLRASIGDSPEISELGAAWKVSFRHNPSANDGLFDVWAAQRLEATAWLSPGAGRFLRIDYVLPKPARLPEGGRLMKYSQSYLLERDPVYDLSLITSFTTDFEARGGLRTERRHYTMQVRQMEVFFANPAAEAEFFEKALFADADEAGDPG